MREQRTLQRFLLIFWGGYWLLNGLDKFFNQPTFFGVMRDEKFINYFANLALPETLALLFLYLIAIAEILLGLAFFASLVNADWERARRHTVFFASMAIFAIFSFGDILFGDRAELWEHGTFLILVIVSYRFYLRHWDGTPATHEPS